MTLVEKLSFIRAKPECRVIFLRGGAELADGKFAFAGQVVGVSGEHAAALLLNGAVEIQSWESQE